MTPAPMPARPPVATYRLQLNAAFGFADAARLVPYLARLGVSDCYCSPVLAASPGSTHGYDICDHSRLNGELGGEAQFAVFSEALSRQGLDLIVDFVPNHMSIDPSTNLWWRDVLENGPSSPYAKFFDIDWDPAKDELEGKVLLPVLGAQYGTALESGDLRVEFREGIFGLRYGDLSLPLNPRQIRLVLRHNLNSLKARLTPEDPDLTEFLSTLFLLDHIPAYTETDPALMADRAREKEVAKARVARLVDRSAVIRGHIEENVKTFNGTPGQPGSFDLLHTLLEAQAYRLAYWQTAMHEINYRRFFDINTLAGIRMEDPDVFTATHTLMLDLIRQGKVSGLRLDHVDGLFDPAEYFRRLAANWGNDAPVYTLVEKILSQRETLSEDWAVHGTTGYDFLNEINGLFVDRRNERELRRLYTSFTGAVHSFAETVYVCKKLIITTSMASELNVLANELNRISESDWHFRDFTLDSLREALREVVACFPVYRTYVGERGWSAFDESCIDGAIRSARRRNPAMEPTIFDFVRKMLLPGPAQDVEEGTRRRRLRFAMKFQQYTGPVQAKGVEDTAFYRYTPLLSLNDVGGDPARFGLTPQAFHRSTAHRHERWPLSMLATSTHDTKRGEDARARINVLSEIPDEWRKGLFGWSRLNATAKTAVHSEPAPDRNDEYLYSQALASAWPAEAEQPTPEFVDRMRQYMAKALKEAKVHTSWISPSQEYDDAMSRFVERTLVSSHAAGFLEQFLPLQQRVAYFGMLNALAQLTLKIASPGVPEFYQGTELWDLTLVDPDNRRPIDFTRRMKCLEEMEPCLDDVGSAAVKGRAVEELFAHWHDGRIKLYLTAAGLRLRRQHASLFLRGEYLPLAARGAKKNHVVACGRRHGNSLVLAVVPRLVVSLTDGVAQLPVGPPVWAENWLVLPGKPACASYRNVFTGESIRPVRDEKGVRLRLGEVFRSCPVALLIGGLEGEPSVST